MNTAKSLTVFFFLISTASTATAQLMFFELVDPVGESGRARKTPNRLDVMAGGQTSAFIRDRQFDLAGFEGYSQVGGATIVRWPTVNRGYFQLGTATGLSVSFRNSRMQIRRVYPFRQSRRPMVGNPTWGHIPIQSGNPAPTLPSVFVPDNNWSSPIQQSGNWARELNAGASPVVRTTFSVPAGTLVTIRVVALGSGRSLGIGRVGGPFDQDWSNAQLNALGTVTYTARVDSRLGLAVGWGDSRYDEVRVVNGRNGVTRMEFESGMILEVHF